MLNFLRFSTIKFFITQNPFRKEMVFVMVIKLVAIVILATFFISTPHPDQLNQVALIKHFVK